MTYFLLHLQLISRKLRFEKKKKIIKSSLSHIVLLKNNCLCYKMCCFLFIFFTLKIGCMLNVIHFNKSCIACCSVWHRATTVYFVILMWITSCKISWYFAVNRLGVKHELTYLQLTAWLAAQWCGLVVMYNVQHIVTNHTKSQIS